MTSCYFETTQGWHCGSYAFNLRKEGIDQGNLCDRHYWETRARAAEARLATLEAKVPKHLIPTAHDCLPGHNDHLKSVCKRPS